MNNIIEGGYRILPIDGRDTHGWLLKKHYAHRIPSISYAFGLFKGEEQMGICTFGAALPMQLKRGICGKEYQERVFELNRLCVNEGLEKNVLSFFVSQCLKLLPRPMIVVSYSDMAMGHHGYIYQATNFLYTGTAHTQMDWKVKGQENKHSRTLMDEFPRTKGRVKLLQKKYGDQIYQEMRPDKHRYIYFVGDKKQKKELLKALKYEIKQYPKGKNERYDASFVPDTTLSLWKTPNTKGGIDMG